jgi:hypothetical protein
MKMLYLYTVRGLYCDAVSWPMNDESERTWLWLSQNLPGGTEENHKERQSE